MTQTLIDNDIGFDTIFDGQQLCRGNNAQIGIINLTCDPRMIIDILDSYITTTALQNKKFNKIET